MLSSTTVSGNSERDSPMACSWLAELNRRPDVRVISYYMDLNADESMKK